MSVNPNSVDLTNWKSTTKGKKGTSRSECSKCDKFANRKICKFKDAIEKSIYDVNVDHRNKFDDNDLPYIFAIKCKVFEEES